VQSSCDELRKEFDADAPMVIEKWKVVVVVDLFRAGGSVAPSSSGVFRLTSCLLRILPQDSLSHYKFGDQHS
jgi:hypothetical protein